VTRTVAVTKMHGARNDFVVVDCRTAPIAALPQFARWACDRHAGIGADGVIAIVDNDGRLGMRTINADGSEAELCANGLRCAARFLEEAGEGSHAQFDTRAGIVSADVIAKRPEYVVRTLLGTPRVRALPRAGLEDAFVVDVGNPHVVAFVPDADAFDLGATALRLQTDREFPSGANVHACTIENDGGLRVRHWERGAGLTQACGTGAVACAAAAIASGRAASPVEVRVPGGRLVVEWDGGVAAVTGPAARVFDTTVQFADEAGS
jgi:diaminopimelate epimerase